MKLYTIIFIIMVILFHTELINKLEINNSPDCDYNGCSEIEFMGKPSGHVEILIIINCFVCMYLFIYILVGSEKSVISCIFVFIILLILCTIKNDYIIKNQKIPTWVDKDLYKLIDKKMNKKEKYFELIFLTLFPEKVTIYTWDTFEKYLYKSIEKYKINIDKIDVVIGIKTGGAFLANYIGKKYNKKYSYIKLLPNYENDSLKHLSKLFKNNLYKKIKEIKNEDFKDKNILLVDDIIYSGSTMNTAFSYLKENGAKNIKTFVLHEHIHGKSIIFPWGFCS